MSYAGLLNDVVNIQRESAAATTASGRIIRSFATIATGVPCSLQIASEMLAWDDPGSHKTGYSNSFFLVTQDIVEKDRVVHVTKGTFEVKSVDKIRGKTCEVKLRLLTHLGT